MGTFYLTADNIFLLGLNEMEISVREINADLLSGDFNRSDWREVTKISLNGGSNYNQLSINGVQIRGQQLKGLASDLFKSGLHVNHQGYCYLYVGTSTTKLEAFGVLRYRLNDFFGWSKYGVVPSVNMIWDKCDLHTRRPVINLTEQNQLLEDCKSKLKDYESQMKEKDQELKDYKLKLSMVERELIRSEIHLEEKNTEVKDHVKENELSSLAEKLLIEKDKKLKEYESQLTERERELSLFHKHLSDKAMELEEFQLQLRNKEEKLSPCEKSLQEKIKELEDCKLKLEEMDEELSLCKDKNRVNALKATVISLVDSLYHLKMTLQQKQYHALPAVSNNVIHDVSSSDDPQGRNNLAQMTQKILEIILHLG